MKKSICFSAVFILSVFSLSLADEPAPAPVPKSEEITVTATKTPKSVKNSPAIVEVLHSDDINKKNPLTFDEALRDISGLYAYRGHGVSTVTPFVSLRGTGYQSRTLVLVDNQALNEYYYHGGGVNFNAIPVDSIERIEVVKGPFSSLYGGNAMGGVINVITKTPDRREAVFKTSVGSFGSQTYHVSYADRFGWFGLSLSADKKEAEGYEDFFVLKKPSSGTASTVVTGWKKITDNFGSLNYMIGSYGTHVYNDETVKLKMFFDLSEKSKLELSVLKNTENREHAGESSFLTDQNGNAVNSGTVQISDNGSNYKINIKSSDFLYSKNWKDLLLTTLSFEHKLNEKINLHTHFGFNEQNRRIVAPQTVPKGNLNYSPFTNIQFEQQADIKLGQKHTLTCGVELKQVFLIGKSYNLYDWEDKGSREQMISKSEGGTRTTALYLQDEYNLMKNLALYPGIRLDYWKNYDGSYYDSTYGAGKQTTEYPDNSEKYVSPKLSFVYEPVDMTVLKASWGKAFRGPGPDDLYRNNIIYSKSILNLSNPDLRPETMTSYEVGVESYFSDTMKISVAAWHSNLENMIYKVYYDTQDVNDYNTQYGTSLLSIRENANIGKSEINGLEFAVRRGIFTGLSFIGNYTYTSTRINDYEADDTIEGKRFIEIPLHNAILALEYEKGGFFFNTMGRYASKRYASDDNTDKVNGGYGSEDQFFVFSTNFAYKIPSPNLTFSLSVDNIFDREYYDIYIVPGRTFVLEVEYVF